MSKEILFGEKAREIIKKGAEKIAKAVRITIGPFGRNVVLQSSFGGPTITNDGVSIAKDISIEDNYENIGADILKEVANKTNEQAGDGTSTSIILTYSMMEEGIKHINKGVNALFLRKGMEKAHELALKKLSEMKKEIKGSPDAIKQVATISAENTKIGEIIAETILKVGEKGVITVEESNSFNIESEVVHGLEINKGFISPYMMTNTERQEAEYKNVPVIITDAKVSSVKEIFPLLEKLAQAGKKEIVIIADDVDGEALATFVLNKLRGALNVLAIKAPGFGDSKKDMLQDIATTVGAEVVSKEKGISFENAGAEVVGEADRVVSTKDKTIIIGNEDSKKNVDERIKELEKQEEMAESKFDKDKLNERIAKLSGGVAVVRVGAATEQEMKYLKHKIEDAVNATKSAIEEGIVSGGGSTFLHTAKHLADNESKADLKNEYETSGYRIVTKALEAPFTQIVDNVYGDGEGIAILREIQKAENEKIGYDAANKVKVDDMFEAGIVDPVKVLRSALSNAVSTVGIFLTTEVAVVDSPKKEEENNQNPMGGMGMY